MPINVLRSYCLKNTMLGIEVLSLDPHVVIILQYLLRTPKTVQRLPEDQVMRDQQERTTGYF